MADRRPSRWFYLVLYVLAMILSMYLADYWKRALVRAYERRAESLHRVTDNVAGDAPSAHDLQAEIDSHLKEETHK